MLMPRSPSLRSLRSLPLSATLGLASLEQSLKSED